MHKLRTSHRISLIYVWTWSFYLSLDLPSGLFPFPPPRPVRSSLISLPQYIDSLMINTVRNSRHFFKFRIEKMHWGMEWLRMNWITRSGCTTSGSPPFCSIQGLVAAHWPRVALPTWPYADIPARLFPLPTILGKEGFCERSVFCVLSVLSGDDDRRVGCDTVADFSITGFGASETRDSFATSQAEHFVTAKGPVEIGRSPALVYTTGLLRCTT